MTEAEGFKEIGLHSLYVSLTLIICIFAAYIIKAKGWHFFPEQVFAIFFGFAIGAIMAMISEDEANFLKFSSKLFFFALLPPIILEGGYTMKRQNFFGNFSTILLFAGLGTFISAGVIAVPLQQMSAHGMFGDDLNISVKEALMFGALMSSIDPVATLSILGSKDVDADPLLYAIVFGESMLNDAVCIGIYDALSGFSDHMSTHDIVEAFGVFIGISIGSAAVGVGMAMVLGFLLKRINMHKHPAMEFMLVLLTANACYCVAEVGHLSGIVSLFFCGAGLAHYNWYNLSKTSRDSTAYGFKGLALAAETFIFVYMGIATALSMFGDTYGFEWNWKCALTSIALVFISRAANVFPMAFIANLRRKRPVSFRMQLVIWLGGLRGSFAFALALNLTTENRSIMVTSCLACVLFTTIICGAAIEKMVTKLGVKRGGGAGARDPLVAHGKHDIDLAGAEIDDDEELIGGAGGAFGRRKGGFHLFFSNLDNDVLRPLFGGPRSDRATIAEAF